MSVDVPPAYTQALQQLGANPSIQDVQKTVDQLASLNLPPPAYDLGDLSHEQKTQLTTAVAQSLSSDEGNTIIKQTVQTATDSIKTTESMFIALNVKLSAIDQQYTSPTSGAFAPTLIGIQQQWQLTVSNSKTVAIEISAYASRFANLIIPLIDDNTHDLNFKQAKVQQFIDSAQGFVDSSQKISADYDTVLAEFASLTGTFSTWASDKSDDLKAKLKTAEDELADLQEQLARKRAELIGVGAGAAATLPITGIAAACAGIFAPAVIIIGLITAGALAITAVVLGIQAQQLGEQVDSKTAEVADLQSQIKAIDDARKDLVTLGQKDLLVMQSSVEALNSFWSYAKADAVKIKTQLENAKGDFDWPAALHTDSQNAINLYNSMAVYLDEYAKGIDIQ